MSSQVQVQVPQGMQWCTGGKRVVSVQGTTTLNEVWERLTDDYPDLMWRLTKDGQRSPWVQVAVDGLSIPKNAADVSIQGASIITFTIIEGAPTAAPMGSRNPF